MSIRESFSHSKAYNTNFHLTTFVIDNIKIHSNTQIGGGGVVIKNINKNGLYVGNPVRFIDKNNI